MHNSKKCRNFAANSVSMSTAQAIASEQFLSAMGTMVEDDRKVSAVINYILLLKQQEEKPLIDPEWRTQATTSHEEFWEQLYHEVGALYGLNDIREAKESKYDKLNTEQNISMIFKSIN